MSTTPRPPLLSDEELQTMSGHGEMTAWEKYVGEEVRDRYEAARAKDAERIEQLEALCRAMGNGLDEMMRPPLLSDEDVRAISESESEFPDHWRDGFGYAETIYEAARAKDTELIQRLVDCVDMLEGWCDFTSKTMELAAAAGFKPSEP